MSPEEAKDDKKTFFIIWNPESDLPPRVRFENKTDAEKVAESMALRFGEPFFVCEVQTLYLRPLKAKKTVLK